MERSESLPQTPTSPSVIQVFDSMSTNSIQAVIEELFPSFRQQEKITMYEQSLDAEYFNPAFTMYQAESRFYDDYNHQQVSNFIKNNPQQHHQQSQSPFHTVGLPTPPSTPDKPPMSYGNFNSHPQQQLQQHPPPSYFNSQQNYVQQQQHQHQHQQQHQQQHPFSPNDMQVVPDFLTSEKDNLSPEANHNFNQNQQHLKDSNYSNQHQQPPRFLSLPQHNTEIRDAGHKRMYPSNNQSLHSPIDYYVNNQCENDFVRQQQFAYEMYNHHHNQAKHPRYDSSADSIEPELSRATHNILERQRRNDLKLRFSLLRDNIPELASNEKAPKIQILRKGLEYLSSLKREEQTLIADKELEKQKKLILLSRLKYLRSQQY